MPVTFDAKGIEIGPIPKGTPVDLLANFDPLPRAAAARRAASRTTKAASSPSSSCATILRRCRRTPTDDQARKVFANVGEQLFALSKCPDYVVNRGHYFGTDVQGEPG